jgi:hypothetical protein
MPDVRSSPPRNLMFILVLVAIALGIAAGVYLFGALT